MRIKQVLTLDITRWLVRPLLAIVTTVLALATVEAVSWVILQASPAGRPLGRWEFRSEQLPPYQDAPYYGKDFLDESIACVRMINPPDGNYLVLADYKGRFINVENGLRRTTDGPPSHDHRVLLFGGSTVFCGEVPDEYTLASCLQRLLNGQRGPRFLVENYGTPAMIACQETERLSRTNVDAGDVVVFFDGVNDVVYPVYHGKATGYRLGDEKGVRKLNGAQAWLYPLCMRWKDDSSFALLLFRRLDASPPAELVDTQLISCNLDAAETGYASALEDARTIAEKNQARFLHFLQPHLFSLERPSDFERRTLANDLRAFPGLDDAFRLGYPRLRQGIDKARQNGLASYDLSAALNARPEGAEYYFDFCHVNHVANEQLARVIATHLCGGATR